jgi:hypothetical protein
MDYLSHEPEITLFAFAEAPYSFEKVEIYTISRIKAYSVDIERLYPVVDSVDNVVTNAHIAQIKLNKVIMAVPALIPERVAAWTWTAEIKVLEPVTVL